MAAGLADQLFWGSLAASSAVAFAVTVPVNRALIARARDMRSCMPSTTEPDLVTAGWPFAVAGGSA